MTNKNRRTVPGHALEKLIELSDTAEVLSLKLVKMEQGIAEARARLTGAFDTPTGWDDTRAALDDMVRDLPTLKKRCDAAQATHANARVWLDQLPAATVLEPVTPKLDGYTLASVRRQIADLEQEQQAIQSAPPPPNELAQAVEDYVKRCAEPPTTILYNGEISPRWGTHTAYGPDPSRSPRDVWNTMCWLLPEIMVKALTAEIERKASAAQKTPRQQRAQRLTAIEKDLERLVFAEEALLCAALADGQTVERRPDVPAPAILGVRISKEVMAEERAQRVERRQRAASTGAQA